MNMEFIPELQAKLELLESRIGALLGLVRDLRQDNARLKGEILSAQEMMAAERKDIDRLHEALAEAERWKTETQELRKSRDQVVGRIENLLKQLDDLQMEVAGS
ncbi:hypothetical protein JW823_01655 [bacterium]|nr:hypothetical protein [candidate division CSSED10-310 bacterium]